MLFFIKEMTETTIIKRSPYLIKVTQLYLMEIRHKRTTIDYTL